MDASRDHDLTASVESYSARVMRAGIVLRIMDLPEMMADLAAMERAFLDSKLMPNQFNLIDQFSRRHLIGDHAPTLQPPTQQTPAKSPG